MFVASAQFIHFWSMKLQDNGRFGLRSSSGLRTAQHSRFLAVLPLPQGRLFEPVEHMACWRCSQKFITLRMNIFMQDSLSSRVSFPDISQRSFVLVVLTSFAIAIVLHAVLYASGFYAISADENGRVLDALAWASTSDILIDAWLPFYQVATGLALRVAPDVFTTPRVLSFAFGLAAHAVLIGLTWELFRRRDITAVAAAISAVLHHRVIFGVVPLAEIMYMTALLAAMALLARRLRTGSTLALLLSACCLALGTTIRYEAWFFGVVLVILLCIAPLRRAYSVDIRTGEIVAVLAILAAFPLWWMWQQHLHTGHPTGFLVRSPDRFAPMAGGFLLIKALWHNAAVQFVVQNIITLLILGLLPAFDMWRTDRRARFWLSVPLGALLLLSLVLLAGKGLTTHNPWRLASGWSLLLVPFAACWLVESAHRQPGNSVRQWSLPLLVVGVCAWQTVSYARTLSVFSKADLRIGRTLAQIAPVQPERDSGILVETSDWQYLNIVVASGTPARFLYNSGADPLFPQDTLLPPGTAPNKQILQQKHIRYMLFKSAVYTVAIERDTTIGVLARSGGWTLYELPAPGKQRVQ